jgi:hypothetical protein
MKKAKAARVPILENAFEVNLSKLIRMAKASGDSRLVLDDGDVRTVAVLAETRLAVFLGARHWVVDIVSVPCLQGRVRPLLKCPRAHAGNFQSLYFRKDELACRDCHALRYRTNVAASAAGRAQIARVKLLAKMGAEPGQMAPLRQAYKWRARYRRMVVNVARLTGIHYENVHAWLNCQGS